MAAELPIEVVDLLRKTFPDYEGPVTGDLVAADVAGWDSLRHVELIFGLEDLLGKMIDPGASMAAPNLGALIALATPDSQL